MTASSAVSAADDIFGRRHLTGKLGAAFRKAHFTEAGRTLNRRVEFHIGGVSD